MSIANTFQKSTPELLVSITLLMALAPVVYSQVPAQVPLISKSGGSVSPNLMLTLDDSGSLQFQHMPESVFAGGTFTTTNPVGSYTVRWDPNDNYQISVNFLGTVPGNITSTNYVLRALRSPDTNTIFYNPETRYLPWLTSDGVTRLPASPPAAAYENPLIRTGASGTTVNLTSYMVPSGSSNWCYAGTSTAAASGAGCASVSNNSSTLKHDPGVYFRLQTQDVAAGSLVAGSSYTIKTIGTTNFIQAGAASNTVGLTFTATGAGSGTGVATAYKAVNNYANYTGYSINALPASTTYTKYPNRIDCVAVAGSCNQAEERQNFANWFTYSRTRNLMVRGALMESFATVNVTPNPTTGEYMFRLGFGRINKSSASVDGVNTAVLESNTSLYGGGGVRTFDQTRKNNLFKWLEDLPASGGTPLPAALQAMGEYYKRADSKGPWTDNPGQSGNTVANNKTCRRSYQLMTTDGYWNGTPPSLTDPTGKAQSNQDATAGLTITSAGGGTYQYVPTTPYADGAGNTLADVAMKYWKEDLQTMDNNVAPYGDNPSTWQNMTNFMVGLGVRGNLDPAVDLPALVAGSKTWQAPSATLPLPANIDDLWHAAVNSRGAYYSAKDPSALATAIKGALAGVQGGTGSTAGVATASTVLENSNRKYVPTYKSGEWSGNVSALPLDANGQTTASVWTAADRMPAWNTRHIYTWDTAPLASPSIPGAVPFTWATLSAANKTAMGSLSSVPTTYTSDFISFLWGDHSKEGVGNPFRTRTDGAGNSFILGDFVNSNPVLIKGSFDGAYGGLNLGGATGYSDFLAAKAARTAVLFVGGNDGMLHAFKDTKGLTPTSTLTDGQEIFAYVPRIVYPNLYMLADKTYGTPSLAHQYYVDGPQRESDAFVRAPGATAGSFASSPSWRNYLMGSLGAGGRAVYALDVTDAPTLGASSIRWEITDPDLGYVMAPIEVGVLPNGKWVAIFGNGFASNNGYATLFVVDLETAAITKLNVETSGGNGLGGVAVQRNTIGQITNLFAGDLKGNMWKFDYNTTSGLFGVAGSGAFFTAKDASNVAQSIIQPPAIFNHSQGGKIIVFGTGKLLTSNDAADTSTQTIYGVWDKPADGTPRPMLRAILAQRTLSAQNGTGSAASATFYGVAGTTVNWSTQRGWYIDLSNVLTGGRVIYPTQAISSKLALVSAVAPAQTAVVCQNNDGIGIDLVLEVEGGMAPTSSFFDTNGDGFMTVADALNSTTGAFAAGYKTNADGIDSVVSSSAKNSSGAVADGPCSAGFYRVSIQNATGQTMGCVPIENPGATTRPFSRVQRRIINPPIN